MPPKPGDAGPPAAAAPARRRDAMDAEAASQLTQLTLFCLLAAVMWFVAVEQPKLEQVPGLLATVKEMKKQARDLKEELAATNRELERVEKASPAGMQASSMKVFQREYEERATAIRSIVEDVQRQLGAERKQREEDREKDRDIVGQLSQHVKWLDTQVHNLREEVDSANRLERANALLEGRLPADFARPGGEADGAGDSGDGNAGKAGAGPEGASSGAQSAGADVQPATGGLVELRHGDFPKLLREGDSWVVMFYAPWCGHCTAAAPAFQQAALQAPVHFARLDAAAHPDVAQSEGITGFPTIRFYSKGEVVRCESRCVFLRPLPRKDGSLTGGLGMFRVVPPRRNNTEHSESPRKRGDCALARAVLAPCHGGPSELSCFRAGRTTANARCARCSILRVVRAQRVALRSQAILPSHRGSLQSHEEIRERPFTRDYACRARLKDAQVLLHGGPRCPRRRTVMCDNWCRKCNRNRKISNQQPSCPLTSDLPQADVPSSPVFMCSSCERTMIRCEWESSNQNIYRAKCNKRFRSRHKRTHARSLARTAVDARTLSRSHGRRGVHLVDAVEDSIHLGA